MATTADFRNGLCIVFKDDLYRIVQFQHVKPGKGPAFVRTKDAEHQNRSYLGKYLYFRSED